MARLLMTHFKEKPKSVILRLEDILDKIQNKGMANETEYVIDKHDFDWMVRQIKEGNHGFNTTVEHAKEVRSRGYDEIW